MNINKIRKLAGDIIFRRGKDYFNRGLVEVGDSFDPGVYYFTVKGSGRNMYRTVIDFEDDKLLCNCPYPRICKHIVAALLYLNFKAGFLKKGIAASDNLLYVSGEVIS